MLAYATGLEDGRLARARGALENALSLDQTAGVRIAIVGALRWLFARALLALLDRAAAPDSLSPTSSPAGRPGGEAFELVHSSADNVQCANCEGVIPADHVRWSEWHAHADGSATRRHVVQCPHCGFRHESRQQRPYAA